ncbi:MAG: FAD-dependent oxidoreductase [Thermoleophilia bacterium]|nr:FAD-dependent oxidoreductase [Thermoleophilia bacterium]
MRVAVVGGGAVGLACAHALARAGAEVVLLERGRCGEGCSYGNTGWICPALSAPLPAPKVMARALLGMWRRDSPLLVQPRLDASFVRWSWEFWRACSPERYRAGLHATVAFARPTFALFEELRAQGVAVEIHTTGMVVAARTEAGLNEYVEMVEGAREAGYEGPVELVDGDELRRREPSLDDTVLGGLVVGAERYVRPEAFTAALADALGRRGAEVREGADVRGLERRAGSWHVLAGDDSTEAEAVVVAAGAWSGRLLEPLGIRLPLEAAKGYSVTASGEGTTPRHALYLAEAKVGASPYDGLVRLAGIFDLTGIDSRLRRRRIGAIVRASLPYFHDWRPQQIELEWAGLRPYPADGLPIVGPVPGHQGLFAATGHGRLGITLAPATGEAVRHLVLEGETPAEVRPFTVERLLR